MSAENATTGFRLGDYLHLLRRHWLAVLLCLILGIGGALAYLKWAPKEYQSTTAVLVTSMSDSPSSNASAKASDINLDTEAQLVTSTDTAQAARDKLHASADALTLVQQVSVSVPPNTDILDITYTDSSPSGAQRGSLAFAQAYLDQRKAGAQADASDTGKALQTQIDALTKQLQQVVQAGNALPPNSPDRARSDQQASALNSQIATLQSQQNQLTIQSTSLTPGRIVTEPQLPSSPSSPNRLVTLAAGLVLGLLVGVGVAALRSRADDVVRHPEDLFRRTRVPVATVLSGRLHAGQVAILPPLSADGRGYARLRNLVTTGLSQASRPVVVVAGVRHGGGPVAANLAASLARAGESVHLICADVFGATSSALLSGGPRPGLAEVLGGDLALDEALQDVPAIPGLRVLGPGRDPDRADALLQTRSPRKLVDEMLRHASYVVIEAPPTSDSPDAQTLANVAELAVVVVEIGQTGAAEVLDACAQFESMGTPVLGAVAVRYGRAGDRDRGYPDAAAEESASVDEAAQPDGTEEPPAAAQPAVSQPAVSQPAVSQPAVSQPAVSQPAVSQPAGRATGKAGATAAADDDGDGQLVPRGIREPFKR